MFKKIFNLLGLAVSKNPDGNPACRLCGELSPKPFGLVFSDDTDFIFSFEPELDEPQA